MFKEQIDFNMKKPILFILLIIILLGCKGDGQPEGNIIFPITFNLNVLNENGKAATSFPEGEDIVFSFEMTNITNKEQVLYYGFCDIIVQPTSEFFRIYKYDVNETNLWIDLGRPCMPEACAAVMGYHISADSTTKIQYSWRNQWLPQCTPNNPLQKGKYKTGFQYEFEMLGSEFVGLKSNKILLVEFEVY
jgi:hypothetical protein